MAIGALLALNTTPSPDPAYSWGDTGNVSVSMVLDTNTTRINATVNATISVTNTGTTSIRLYRPQDHYSVQLVSSNGTTLTAKNSGGAWMTQHYNPNTGFITLAPGKTITGKVSFGNITYSVPQSLHGGNVDIRANETYAVTGIFSESPVEYPKIYPHWTGTVRSETAQLAVAG